MPSPHRRQQPGCQACHTQQAEGPVHALGLTRLSRVRTEATRSSKKSLCWLATSAGTSSAGKRGSGREPSHSSSRFAICEHGVRAGAAWGAG